MPIDLTSSPGPVQNISTPTPIVPSSPIVALLPGILDHDSTAPRMTRNDTSTTAITPTQFGAFASAVVHGEISPLSARLTTSPNA